MSDRDFFNNIGKEDEPKDNGAKFDLDKLDGFNTAPKSLPVVGIAIGLAIGLAAILLVGKFLLPSKNKTSSDAVPVVKAEEGDYKTQGGEADEAAPFKDSSLYEDLASKNDKVETPLPQGATEDAQKLAPIDTVKAEPVPVAKIEKKTPKAAPVKPKKEVVAKKVVSATKSSGALQLQIASLNTQESANKVIADFTAKNKTLLGNKKMIVLSAMVSGVTKYRVRIDGFASKAEAETLKAELAKKNITSFVTK